MNAQAPRPLRADAARNVERIVLAAREVFAEQAAEAQLSDIARRAGVGEATLYRHFANKEDLIRAVARRRFDDDVHPVIKRAISDPDPWQAMVTMLEVCMEMISIEGGTYAAARDPAIFVENASRHVEAFAVVLRRAQDAGAVRADLLPEDLPRLINMLIGAQRLGTDPEKLIGTPRLTHDRSQAWRRYLALLLDALRPAAANPLPPLSAPRRFFHIPDSGSTVPNK